MITKPAGTGAIVTGPGGLIPIPTYSRGVECDATCHVPDDYGGAGVHVASYGSGFGNATFSHIACGHRQRFLWSGRLKGVHMEFATGTLTNFVSIKFVVYRYKSGTNVFTAVGESSVFGSGDMPAVAGWTEDYFDVSADEIDVQVGDLLGCVVTTTGSSDVWSDITGWTGLAGGSGDVDPATHDWEYMYASGDRTGAGDHTFSTSVTRKAVGMYAVMDSPVIAGIGDSLLIYTGDAWTGGALSFLDGLPADSMVPWDIDPTVYVGHHLEVLDPALGGIRTAKVGSYAHEWDEDAYVIDRCVAYSPQAAIISLGQNDISGSRTLTQYLTDLSTIIQKLRMNGVRPIMLDIMPKPAGTAAQKAAIRAWNPKLHSWCRARGIPCVPANATLADPADPDGWDTTRFGSGSHPNAAAYQAVAETIAGLIVKQPLA